MREQYWDLFTTTKITQFYYQFYAVRAARGKTIVSAVCLFASGSLALTFPSLVSGKLKVLWAALIFAAQLISILQPSFPFEKQAAAASYLQRELAELTAQMEIFWVCHNYEGTEAEEAQYDTDFRKAWVEYRTQADAIEYRFVTADSFPPNKRLNKRAEKEAEIFLGRFLE